MSDKCYNRECRDADNSDSGCRRFNYDSNMEGFCGDYMYNPLLPLARESLDDLEKQVTALTTERDTLKEELAITRRVMRMMAEESGYDADGYIAECLIEAQSKPTEEQE